MTAPYFLHFYHRRKFFQKIRQRLPQSRIVLLQRCYLLRVHAVGVGIAMVLADKFSKDEILYDKFHEADFARPQLDVYLQKLYHDCSDLIVVFLCDQYSQKRWCGVEWRAIRDILNNFNYEKIMYVKVSKENIDDITLPGFYGSQDGYIDANTHTPQEISDLIIERYMQTSPTATGVAK